jgi:hypothetical protein
MFLFNEYGRDILLITMDYYSIPLISFSFYTNVFLMELDEIDL